MTVEFRVLGTLEVLSGGRPIGLPAGHSRVVLAGLLLRANEVVPVEQLVRWLWDGAPPNPDRAVKTVHMIVARLRKSLGEANVVATAPGGYVALVQPRQLDLTRFRDLVAEGAAGEALALWRGPGPVLTDVMSDSLHQDEIAPLVEERLAALDLRIAADLAQGRHRELVPELRGLTRQHPLRESFWAHLVLALYRSDQQGDALAAYRTIARTLAEELGATPSPGLRELHQQILVGSVDPPDPVPPVPAVATVPAVPRQLPPVCPHFIGRDDELAALDAVSDSATMTIAVINGTAGVGKSTLAVRWAHAVADRFPDGQLFVNLRGFGADEPLRPEEVLRDFLAAFDVPDLPSTADGRAARFRSLLTDRKVLVLLDNARDAEQVRPLLPAHPGCLVLVTSRSQLSGLVAKEGARPLTLAVLPREEALALLEQHVGTERVQAEAEAAEELVARCAGLPLALLIVAKRAAARRSLREVADELAALPPDLTAVFSWSYEQLQPAAARLFRWLSLHPGRELGVHAAAALAGLPVARTRRLLRDLRNAHLVTEVVPDRFSRHDLLCAYSADLCAQLDTETDRQAATHRVLDYYLYCADVADGLRPITTTSADIKPEHVPTETPPLRTLADATAWFDTELPNVVAAVEAAAPAWPTHAWQLTHAVTRYLGLRADLDTGNRLFLASLPGAPPEVRVLMMARLGVNYSKQRNPAEALRWLEQALAESSSPEDRARVLTNMSMPLEKLGRHDEAEHRLRQAIEAGEAGAAWIAPRVRHRLGNHLAQRSRHAEAEAEFRHALRLYGDIGETVGAQSCLHSLSLVHTAQGRLDEALTAARDSLAMSPLCDSPLQDAQALAQIGDVLDLMGEDGTDHWQRALTIFESLRTPEADELRAKLQAERNADR